MTGAHDSSLQYCSACPRRSNASQDVTCCFIAHGQSLTSPPVPVERPGSLIMAVINERFPPPIPISSYIPAHLNALHRPLQRPVLHYSHTHASNRLLPLILLSHTNTFIDSSKQTQLVLFCLFKKPGIKLPVPLYKPVSS